MHWVVWLEGELFRQNSFLNADVCNVLQNKYHIFFLSEKVGWCAHNSRKNQILWLWYTQRVPETLPSAGYNLCDSSDDPTCCCLFSRVQLLCSRVQVRRCVQCRDVNKRTLVGLLPSYPMDAKWCNGYGSGTSRIESECYLIQCRLSVRMDKVG